MSVFTSLGILILSMLILMSLKLVPGIFILFTHYNLGKFSKKKVDDLGIFFIFGVETLIALLFVLINSTICILSPDEIIFENPIFPFVMSGIFIALSLATFFFYFKKGPGTKLFISRKTAQKFILKTKSTKNRSDAFVLGLISGIPELIFTIPLYLISIIEISKLSFHFSSYAAALLAFILIVTAPLFILHSFEKTNYNLAEIERLRVKNKTFFRFFISILYLLLAILIIVFGINL